MNGWLNGLKRFVKEEDAPTMVEYGLMVALIAVVCIAAVTLLGANVSSKFNNVATTVGS
jgi:pilus assembly protein Flp/PilA